MPEQLGFARKGQGGADGLEPGALGWISCQHYTARPAVDIETPRQEGRACTDIRRVPLQRRIRRCTRMSRCSTACSPKRPRRAIDLDLLAAAFRNWRRL